MFYFIYYKNTNKAQNNNDAKYQYNEIKLLITNY